MQRHLREAPHALVQGAPERVGPAQDRLNPRGLRPQNRVQVREARALQLRGELRANAVELLREELRVRPEAQGERAGEHEGVGGGGELPSVEEDLGHAAGDAHAGADELLCGEMRGWGGGGTEGRKVEMQAKA